MFKNSNLAITFTRHQQTPLNQNTYLSDPVSVISTAAVFLHAGDYGTVIKLLFNVT